MYKATRMLIEERSKHSKHGVEQVFVKSVPIGEANKCHHNTFEFQMSDVLNTGCKRSTPVSGWLVGKYNKANDETEIIQHWWNIDSITKQHFDTTPIAHGETRNQFEYVMDVEISLWGNENYDKIDSNVCNSIFLRGGKWYLANFNTDQKLISQLVECLEVKDLFSDLSG